ncbi:hypothetical protein GCL60_14635 [Silvanigrella paludirubra]|uniref:Uncharacterized protein n=1 Tax=Silvanigrella paludirubra TaxID=2499159 RepID=A0A6N6VPW8_9BACT|nr:hypothetical protein [Silvanigrella paludirubra]KAB8037064.1 hypothetical protein GCL60_14635 [Silvanigrella paludirubra]
MVLTKNNFNKNVLNVSRKLADQLKICKFLYTEINNSFMSKKGTYPIPKLEFKSNNDVINFFETETDSLLILSVFWHVGFSLSYIEHQEIFKKVVKYVKNNNTFYTSHISPTKDYTEDKNMKDKSLINYNITRFGNTSFVQSRKLFDNKFYSYSFSKDYIRVNANSKNEDVQNFIKNNIPFISGFSGIANLSCKVILLSGIKPKSNESIMFMESMAAFIVASGMHSYTEVYSSYNLFLNLFSKKNKYSFFININ